MNKTLRPHIADTCSIFFVHYCRKKFWGLASYQGMETVPGAFLKPRVHARWKENVTSDILIKVLFAA
jgi:hypothetical protein